MTNPGNSEVTPLETEALPGTVKLYRRHLLVCTGQTDWPARLELGGGFLQTLAEAIQAHADAMPGKVKLTACDEVSTGPAGGHDILVYPEAIRYLGVQPADIPALIEDHLVGGQISTRLRQEPLSGQQIFVCRHERRDERCGQCGPPLIEHIQTLLKERGLGDQVSVHGTSHVGGHRFAGNLLIYPQGDWYGRVTTDHVAQIIDQHLIGGSIVADLWRGRMGLSPAAQLRQHLDWAGG